MTKKKLLENIKKHQKENHQITTNNKDKWVITFECGGNWREECPAAYCWGGCGKIYGKHNHETKTPIRNGANDDRWFVRY